MMMSMLWGYGLLMFFGMTLWVVLLALLIWALIRWLNRRTGPGQQPSPAEHSALEILRQRYARGEIDQTTFEQMRERLQGTDAAGQSGPSWTNS
jgi:putative membrane protein